MIQILEEIERLCSELEELEIQAHSKEIRVPKDWFWHRGCFDALRKLKSSIEEELAKMNSTSMYNRGLDISLLEIKRNLKGLLESLGDELKRIEENKVEYDPSLAQDFNYTIEGLDYYLIQAIKAHKLLEKYAAYDVYSKKKAVLVELGLNIFKNPEITQMMMVDDSIAKAISKILGKHSLEERTIYLWESLQLFYDIIFQKIAIKEVAELMSKDSIRPYLHKSPEFFEEHGADSRLVDQIKRLQNAILNLKYALILLSRIYVGASSGEHIARNAKEDMPKFRQCVRNQEDLMLFYNYSRKIFQIDDMALCYMFLKVVSCFRELFFEKPEEFLSKLEIVVRRYPHKKLLPAFVPSMGKVGCSQESLWEHSINLMKTLKGLEPDEYIVGTVSQEISELFNYAKDDEDLELLIKMIGMHDKLFFVSKLKQKRDKLIHKIFMNIDYSPEEPFFKNMKILGFYWNLY